MNSFMNRAMLLLAGALLGCSASEPIRADLPVADGGSMQGDGAAPDSATPDDGAAPDSAQPGASVDVETCNKSYVFNTITMYYAEHAYPGKTATDLARVVVMLPTAAGANQVPGYSGYATTPSVRDGYAAIRLCDQGSTVTFILPSSP